MKKKKKNRHAVALGRKGGKAPKSKPWGFAVMDKDKLQKASEKGVAARRRSNPAKKS